MEVLLITGSTIDEGRLAKGGDKFTDDYTMECASAGFLLRISCPSVPLLK
ncbi:Formylmethanofuran dehydrogenase (molybdenum) subunit D [Methanosarcina siciliae C2J]|uniref:Formylmethanofuran dehydrogenase (Molybdenum) subunit D n=1 Tax=Methanosarcina siciliae C2J TaxID=1434118 RepID=A0A0E3PIV4_9EURY|nr:Formylmethanofuran dehydrogenase (molybdenum) subunit D [Methanosarcina siciliae C2J]